MTYLEDIKQYAMSKGRLSVAQIQQHFDIPYSKARAVVGTLEDDGVLMFESGTTFRLWCLGETQEVGGKCDWEIFCDMVTENENSQDCNELIVNGLRMKYLFLSNEIKDILTKAFKGYCKITLSEALHKIDIIESKNRFEMFSNSPKMKAKKFLSALNRLEYDVFFEFLQRKCQCRNT